MLRNLLESLNYQWTALAQKLLASLYHHHNSYSLLARVSHMAPPTCKKVEKYRSLMYLEGQETKIYGAPKEAWWKCKHHLSQIFMYHFSRSFSKISKHLTHYFIIQFYFIHWWCSQSFLIFKFLNILLSSFIICLFTLLSWYL